MFWLAYRGDLPIFNLASCSMFSKATIADVVLPWIMTGERVEADTLAALGFGGLLDRGMAFRFPPYDVDGSRKRARSRLTPGPSPAGDVDGEPPDAA